METRTCALKLADEMSYCSKQIIVALNNGDLNQYSEWVNKQAELSKEFYKIERARLEEAQKGREEIMKQAEITRLEQKKHNHDMIKQAEEFIKFHNYKKCLSVVR